MKFYNTYYANNYEELLTYYPRFYWDVYEMVEILKAQGRIADKIEENIEQTYLNGFIDYANEPALARLEQFLGIGLNKNRPLDERRRLVKSYFLGFGKLSATKIREMLGVFINNTMDITFLDHVLKIAFNQDIDETMYFHQDIKKLLYQKLPAHILFLVYEKYSGNIKIFAKTETAITFTTAFYPQFNLPELLLNGNWKLDGSKTLNGYDGSEHTDLYPVEIELQTEAEEVIQEKPEILFLTEAKEKITNKSEIKFKASAIYHGMTKKRITIQTEAEVKTGTGEIFMDNQNFLDGSWKMDGSRMLNGGDYQW